MAERRRRKIRNLTVIANRVKTNSETLKESDKMPGTTSTSKNFWKNTDLEPALPGQSANPRNL